MLRPYQQEARDKIVAWIRKSTKPVMIEAATGSGKSHIIASLATDIHAMSKGKHVLCLAPSAELVVQNREKFVATGAPASIFSASAGGKSLRHPVVFGTPMTVANQIGKFGDQFAAVILDECHRIVPTVRDIIDEIRGRNPNLRVIGMTATPYRMGSGYIYKVDPNGREVTRTKDPYFEACVYKISPRTLIDQGFLTPPLVGKIGVDSYETLDMALNSRGQFDAQDIDRAYHGHGRKTSAIIADVVAQARDAQGVMIFAATVRHAQEALASLPPGLSAMVTGETPMEQRRTILRRFKAREIKYLVNVAVLTTGFDAPHVDVIALLRATESASLLQQIIGRGLRLDEGKEHCLILDYAQNLERHCPDGDVFNPHIRVDKDSDGDLITVKCPLCREDNEFSPRPNPNRFKCSDEGYFLDLDDKPIQTEWGPLPSHFGRRCTVRSVIANEWSRCVFRWTFKICPHCNHENDVAARYCEGCKGEIVDPNKKLQIEFKEMKNDPTRKQTDKVISWVVKPTMSRSGKEMDKVEITTPYRTFSVFVLKQPLWDDISRKILDVLDGAAPETITYRKNDATGFYRLYAINKAADEIPSGS